MNQSLLKDLFLELAGMEGTSGKEKKVADAIARKLEEADLPWREDDAGQAPECTTGNILCELNGGGSTVFVAHMDTAANTADLVPEVTSDRIRSSGETILGADNRAGCAVLLHALLSLTEQERKNLSLTVAFTIREELDSLGARRLDLSSSVRMGMVFDSHLRPGHFIHRSYGSKKFTIRIQGKAAHSGLEPEKGINAIYLLSRGIAPLPLGRIDEETTANIGLIRGGQAVNIVPDTAEAVGEIRAVDLARIDSTLQLFEQTVSNVVNADGSHMEFEHEWNFKPFRIDPDEEVYRRVDEALRRQELISIPAVSSGGSDANELNARGIPTLNLGIGAQNPHSHDEFIMLEDLEMVGRIAGDLLRTSHH